MDELERIGREVGRMATGRGRRYAPALKERILRAVAAARERGVRWSAVERAVGVPLKTLQVWQSDARQTSSGSQLCPVVMAEPYSISAPGLSLVSPSGFRVEGLNVDEVAELLSRLGR